MLKPSGKHAMRWTATRGKFDRCQLGHWNQMNVMKNVTTKIQEAVQEMDDTPAVQHAPDAGPIEIAQALGCCKEVLMDPDPDDALVAKAKLSLLQAAKHEPCIGAILRHGGYKPTTKFPETFNTVQACKLTYLHGSDFVDLLLESLRTVVAVMCRLLYPLFRESYIELLL